MQQINIRVSDEEKLVLDIISKSEGISISEIAKKALLKDISSIRVDLAFRLLIEGKIGFKKCWVISGLSYHEFLNEWSKRKADELISEELLEKGTELALNLNIQQLKKDNLKK